jgi:hypothetical protein
MIGAGDAADEKRAKPVAGDCRLLITLVKGKVVARLYRPVVHGITEPVPFSSPWRTITLDCVEDVAAQVQLAGANGSYEMSVPLATLGLEPQDGHRIKGDIGILRGNGFQTLQRIYWANLDMSILTFTCCRDVLCSVLVKIMSSFATRNTQKGRSW